MKQINNRGVQETSKSEFQIKPNKNSIKDFKLRLIVTLVFLAYFIIINFSGDQQQHQSSDLFISSTETFQLDNQNHSVKDSTQNKDKIISQVKREKWELPHNVWIYQEMNEEKPKTNFNTFRQLNILNTKHFAQKSNYTVFEINQQNYQQHLSKSASQKVASVIKVLQDRLSSEKYDENTHQEIKENKEIIIKRLIVYLVLNEKGGVFVNEDVTVVENFDTWLGDILNVVNINVGNRHDPELKAKCFGFYNKDFSSLRMKVNVEREFEFQKKMVVFPSLDDDLIACEKETEFMTKLIEAYLDILFKEHQSLRMLKLNKNETLIGKKQKQIYNHGHLLALHSILQQRQHSLNQKDSQQKYKQLAIDNFGFVTINNNVGPYKLRFYMGSRRPLYAFLSKIQLKYLTYLSGQLRFAHKLDQNIMAYFSQHLASELTPPQFFMKNSFFHTFLLRHWPKDKVYKDFRYATPIKYESLKNDNSNREVIELREPAISPEPEESEDNSKNPQWQSIEKNLWIIWDKGLKGNSNLVVELCFQNLKKSAENSGYKLKFVTDNNVHEYLDNEILQKINYAMTHSNYPLRQQVKSDLWRLALVYKHGGLYVDATTFTTQLNFDFVQNITRIPSGLIWNRYEEKPKTLMFWHGHLGHPSNWKINYKYGTKQQWQLSYENNFIAAEKGSQLIGQWLYKFMEWMTVDISVLEKQMKELDMWDTKWIWPHQRYLLAMDTVKYVIGRRQKWLKDTNNTQYQSASHYYNIWGMSGHMNGQQKLRKQTNFQNWDYRIFRRDRENNNLYKSQYPIEYTEYLVGPLLFQNKFFGFDVKQTSVILERFSIMHKHQITQKDLNQIVHPKSLLNKLLHTDMNKSLELINYYAKQRQSKTKLRVYDKIYPSI